MRAAPHLLRLLALLTLLWSRPAAAQWAVTTWVDTQIDDYTTVQLPYATEAEHDPKAKGASYFTTDTENIILFVGSIDLRYQPDYNPNDLVTAESLSKTFDRIIHHYAKQLKTKEFKAQNVQLLHQDNVVFAGLPARAARFGCFDLVREQPAYLDVIYAWRGHMLYFFGSTYRLPATAETLADKKRFLESVRFPKPLPTREL
ncbi:hypothetical protein LJ737_12110 [Hymenobacter sp. 15J16-1T3B]|uniref:hypothetical protein n=1 Tax=Hymenobacter sp. 15J16-1T3B TaxID=2886941 RepID=UPI001D119CE5|nr:hypothetical protein [Hymenobacter sp. 15J16-1T3B]MCC3157986.1 hypothetical protein [Hymenobacter sp. 15J16-1T3B]